MEYNPKNIDSKKYNIVFCSDDGFAMQLCVAIYSTIKNFSTKEDLNIFVLDSGISSRNKEKIIKSCESFGVNIYFIDIDCSLFRKHKLNHYNEYIFARLFTGNIFTDLDKILYLDCDIVVDGNLKNLMDTNINNYSAGAVPHEFLASEEELNTTLKHIGVNNPLFCSGVMLINLNRRRNNNILNRSYEFYDKHQCPDEDILNNLLHGYVLHFPAKYNATNNLLYTQFYQQTYFNKKEYEEAMKRPVIIHFAGGSKPWHGDCFHKGNRIRHKYLSETLYKDWKLPKQYYFKAQRYKLLVGYIFSKIIALFGYNFYDKCIRFWRRHII